MTTDKSVYQIGEPIRFTFTETNTSNQPIQLALGAFNTGFDVDEAGGPVWKSNAGANPMVIVLYTLDPGDSRSFSSTWDGVPDLVSPPVLAPGVFTVTNQLSPDGPSATFQIASNLSYSLTTDQGNYEIGQAIQFALTETNVTDQPIGVDVAPASFAVSINGTAVWQSSNTGSVTTQTLAPGQSIVQSGAWNGIANTGALLGTNAWGMNFVVTSPTAPPGLSTYFAIANPLSTELTGPTDVESGQAVVLTFTETNTSNQPVIVLDDPGSFEVTSGVTGSSVFSYTETSPPSAVTLQPRQSLTKTATWDTDANSTVPGLYDARYHDDASQGGGTYFLVESSSPITAPPPLIPGTPVSAALATDRSSYKVGHRVRISLTLKNSSDQSVALAAGPGSVGFRIYRGSVVVGQGGTTALAARGRSDLRAQTRLAAGHKKTIALSWLAKPNVRGSKVLVPGVYTIVAWDGSYAASASIRLSR
jgi:Intracellular proteinase inhibitor